LTGHRIARLGTVAAVGALAASTLVAGTAFASARPHVAAPDPVGALMTASGNRSLGVSWTEASTGSITFTATASATGKATRSCTTRSLSCRISALANGTIYNVSVVAKNAGGSSTPTVTTGLVGVPGPPLSVHATGITAAANVMWAPPLASGVTHVTGYMATASGIDGTTGTGSCSPPAATPTAPLVRHCEIPSLAAGKYSVTVTATNAFGTGVPSKADTITVK
jgi:hypothetical protein